MIYTLFENNLNNISLKTGLVLLMNLIAVPAILLWTAMCVLCFPLVFLFMKFILKYSVPYLVRKCIWIYGRGWQKILTPFVIFVPPESNLEVFQAPGVIVVNHRSYFDTYCMNMMPIFDVCFAVRDWPFNIPLYNIFMKLAGYLNIETFSWEKIQAVSKINFTNRSFFLFFPEGHRSRGKELTHFYSGAFKLAVENNVPVIPICLTGTQDLLPPDRCYLEPARIKMEILDPVHPDRFEGEMKHIALKNHVRRTMGQHLIRMDKDLY